ILDSGEIISGGNFHGEPIALASDFLGLSLNILGEISERRVNHLLDPNLNELNKPFLASNPGIESGFMIAQYTDAALISRNKILSYPACMTSIPVSANQEDFVSQAANSCLKLSEIIENLSKIVAIELLVSAQALEERDLKKVSRKTVEIYDFVRSFSEPLKEDRSLSKDINIVANEVLKGELKKLLPSCEEL
ncbi:MAG TPA: aromatic amino acid lyase, partial [Caldisericia bacterium]|nr:aromatic amino acid lyase [Caldisericia bacterium]